MHERLGGLTKVLNKLNQLTSEERKRQPISLRSLYGEGEFFNRNLLLPEAAHSIAEPDQFPHGIRILTGLLDPIIYYAVNNSQSTFLVDNSVRDLTTFSETGTHSRHLLNRLFRSYLNLSNMVTKDNFPADVEKTFLEIQSGSDIDCRLKKPHKNFYETMKKFLLPRMAAALSFKHDVRKTRDYILWSQNPEKPIRGMETYLMEDLLKRRVHEKKHNKYDLVIETGETVNLMVPVTKDNWEANKEHNLYLTLRRLEIADGISVIKFSAGVFLDDTYHEDKMIYPLLAVDFQIISKDNILVRGGTSGSSYDRLIPLKKQTRQEVLTDYRGQSTDAVGLVGEDDKKVLSQPVELGEDWEKIEDYGLRLQVATRVFWQAIESELDKELPTQQISDETLLRIKKGINNIKLEQLPYFLKEMLRTDLLIAMFSSPHHFAEYGIKSGIFELFFPQLASETPEVIISQIEQILEKDNKMKHYKNHQSYREIIRNPRLAREGFINGWQIYDELLGLKQKYPDKKTYLERIWLVVTAS